MKMDTLSERFPKTVDSTVDILIKGMSFSEKTKLANLSEPDLIQFHEHYGIYIQTRFRIPGNDPLIESCRLIAGLPEIAPMQASFVIVKKLHEKLQSTNVLKIVK